MRILAFACLLIAFVAISAESKKIRGLEPSKESLYEPSSDSFFTCLDGSKKIPADRVNDDYCDCKDGSDEPGEKPSSISPDRRLNNAIDA